MQPRGGVQEPPSHLCVPLEPARCQEHPFARLHVEIPSVLLGAQADDPSLPDDQLPPPHAGAHVDVPLGAAQREAADESPALGPLVPHPDEEGHRVGAHLFEERVPAALAASEMMIASIDNRAPQHELVSGVNSPSDTKINKPAAQNSGAGSGCYTVVYEEILPHNDNFSGILIPKKVPTACQNNNSRDNQPSNN